ncbi:MAG: MBL fold metallo-hydrolase [Oscillospiraceae bacterium]|nr:MBL fold metallo-hydrolase [Oscillospiraceae bacterium]
MANPGKHSSRGSSPQKKSSASKSSHSGSYGRTSHSPSAQRKKPALNWPLIVAFAVLLSVYLIVSLFNGRNSDRWKEEWDGLKENVSSSVSGLTGELNNSTSSEPSSGTSDVSSSRPADSTPEQGSDASSAEPSGDTAVTEPETVRVHFIDVGQGDSILIENGTEAVLIDAGENDKGSIVKAYLKNKGIEKLNIAVGTHPHSDHIGGLDTVLYKVPADEVWQPDMPDSVIPANRTYEGLLDAIDACGAADYIVGPGDKVNVCGGLLEVLGPVALYEDLNDLSLVLKFTYGEKSFLFTGDMEKPAEADLIASGADLDADVLKMGHHGSSTSSGNAFLEKVSPDIYVITCGENNDYGHPHREIRQMLKEKNAENWRTDLNGHIVMTCDGKTITTTSQK